jgi:hypothetical protein
MGRSWAFCQGMDAALGLAWLRDQEAEGKYDVIIYDGMGDMYHAAHVGDAGDPELVFAAVSGCHFRVFVGQGVEPICGASFAQCVACFDHRRFYASRRGKQPIF